MALGETHFATDDGSFGAHGNVGRLLSEALAKGRIPDAVYACGANGMLKAIDSLFPTHPRLPFFRRTDGLWNWGLLCLRLP